MTTLAVNFVGLHNRVAGRDQDAAGEDKGFRKDGDDPTSTRAVMHSSRQV